MKKILLLTILIGFSSLYVSAYCKPASANKKDISNPHLKSAPGFASIVRIKTNYTQFSGLTKRDAALIREAINFQLNLGPKIWPGWNSSKAPIIYKSRGTDYLINHPNPPSDFSKFYDETWGDTIMVRVSADKYKYCAAFPVGGIITVVVSAPGDNENPCLWVLMVSHELFHVYQGSARPVNPFTGIYAGKHEMSFPYDFSNANQLAAYRIEAELLFNFAIKQQPDIEDSITPKKVFANMLKVQKIVFTDSLHFIFKQWMEWMEGVARYTENKLAGLAKYESNYIPVKQFADEFPEWNYQKAWNEHYANQSSFIRFIGEKTANSNMFYYAGMAKALILDRVNSDWKREYFKKTLDELLIGK